MASHRLGPGKVAPPRRVLFDSSFLIAVMERPTSWREDIVDRVGNIEPVVLQPVYSELERLAAARGGRSRFAAAAMNYLRESKVRIQPVSGRRADDELMSQALGDGAFVATIDSELIAQLKAAGVSVISLRAGRVELG